MAETIYTQELIDKICGMIAGGMSLRRVCEAKDMPDKATVLRWLSKLDEDGNYVYPSFRDQYARACEERTEAYVEEIFDIADDAKNDYMEDEYDKGKTPGYTLNGENIQRSKLRVDARKWYASKMKPKKYGDKLDVVSDGEKLEGLVIIKDKGEAQ